VRWVDGVDQDSEKQEKGTGGDGKTSDEGHGAPVVVEPMMMTVFCTCHYRI
jgi:hypothetical protein